MNGTQSVAQTLMLAGLLALVSAEAFAEPKVPTLGSDAILVRASRPSARRSTKTTAKSKRRSAATTRKIRTALSVTWKRPATRSAKTGGLGNAGGYSHKLFNVG